MKYKTKPNRNTYKYQTGGPGNPSSNKAVSLATFDKKGNRVTSDGRMPYMKVSDYASFPNKDVVGKDMLYYDPYNYRYLLRGNDGGYKPLSDREAYAFGLENPQRFTLNPSNANERTFVNSKITKGFYNDIQRHVKQYPDIRGRIKETYGKTSRAKSIFDSIDDETLIKQLLDYTATQNKEITTAAYTGGKLKPNKYGDGGGIFKALMSGVGALGGATPLGLAASVGVPLLSGLMQQKTPSTVMGASPGNYKTGGWIKTRK